MPSFDSIIRNSGKGLDTSKDLIYLFSINIGGTLGDNGSGTVSFSNLGRDVEDLFYKGKLQNTGAISRSVQPENGQFETSDLSLSLANGDLEFSKWPWNYSILNKPSILRMGFHNVTDVESGGIVYLADGSYYADGSILANGGPLGAGSPGEISLALAYTLYKGLIKTETRSGKEFNLSIGDYSHKIFKTIPPRIITVTEFPNVGTSVMVEGTRTDFDTDLVGKGIPYIYGDFTDAPLIQPLFIDTVKKRYLIADHAIGTVVKVYSGGTRVFNFTPHISGTHMGTNIMSFIDFGTSQGTKSVLVEIRGREGLTLSSIPIYGTVSFNGTNVSDQRDCYVAPYWSGASSSYVELQYNSSIAYSGTQLVSAGCWIKQYEPNAGMVGIINTQSGAIYWGTSDATTLGTWQWVSSLWDKIGTYSYRVRVRASEQNTGIHFDGFKTGFGAVINPTESSDGTGLILNSDFSNWTTAFGTVVGTRAPDSWVVYTWTHGVPTITVGGTGIIGFGSSYGTQVIELLDSYNSGVITNPALMLKDILTSDKLCGLSSNDIGTASFDIAESFLSPYNFRYIMDGEIHENSVDLIQDISVNSMANFYFDKENLATFNIYRPAVSRSYIRKIQQNEILEDSFSIARDIRDVYNRVLVNYDYDWTKKEYRNAYEIGGTAFMSRFDTIRTYTIDSPFIYTSTEASYAGRRWLSKLQAGLGKVNFSLPISALPLDIGDRLQITHEEPPTASGGWTDRLINITEFEIDNRGKTINLSAIDEDEVNINKRYFILGNGGTTHYHLAATDAQKYYGALCGASGTMRDGSDGYILW